VLIRVRVYKSLYYSLNKTMGCFYSTSTKEQPHREAYIVYRQRPSLTNIEDKKNEVCSKCNSVHGWDYSKLKHMIQQDEEHSTSWTAAKYQSIIDRYKDDEELADVIPEKTITCISCFGQKQFRHTCVYQGRSNCPYCMSGYILCNGCGGKGTITGTRKTINHGSNPVYHECRCKYCNSG
jgi:hypothetical protein